MKIAVGIFVTTLLYVTVTEVSGTPYMHRMRKSEDALQGGQIDQLLAANNGVIPQDGRQPTLYELLVTAIEAERSLKGEKRQYKTAKPCYWSLVSCY